MKNIFSLIISVKINLFNCEKYLFTDESVKRQIIDSISENLTDSDLESSHVFREITLEISTSVGLLLITNDSVLFFVTGEFISVT